jgi:oligopeptide transport system substrate-binding protein
MKKKLLLYFGLFLCVCLLPACSRSQPAPKSTNEIHFAINADPNSLDPRLGTGTTSQTLSKLFFEGMTRITKDGRPVLALASSYTVSEDGTIYTFTLRPSKWSNGLDLTAQDFVYAWKSIVSKEVPTPQAYNFFIIKNARNVCLDQAFLDSLGVRAINKSTLEVALEHPVPYFLELLSFPVFFPVCQAIVENHPHWTKDMFVSNGPFVLDQYQLKSCMLLKKNPLYWDHDSVKTDLISFAVVEDSATAYNMFVRKEIDWYGEPFTTMAPECSQELDQKRMLRKAKTNTIQWLICNTQKKYLSTPEIRQALYLGINRSKICKELFQHQVSPMYSLLSHSFLNTSSFIEDPSVAKEMIKNALYKLGFSEGSYPALHLLVGHKSSHTLICQALQDQLQSDLIIDIKIELCERGMFLHRLFSGKFDLAFASWSSWFNDPIDTLNCLREANSPINCTGWESAEYAKLLELSDQELDQDRRNDLLSQAESIVMREVPIIPVCTESILYTKTNIQGEMFSPLGSLDLISIERGS